MKLVGKLEDLGLGEILQIISFSQKSGILWLNSQKRVGSIVFKDGQVTRATSSALKRDVGMYLVTEGVITDDTLASARELQKSAGHTDNLGSILIKSFGVDLAVIEEATQKLVERKIVSFFFWHDGTFVFELKEFIENPEVVKADSLQYTLAQGMNPQFIAMEGARVCDEFEKDGVMPKGYEVEADGGGVDSAGESAPAPVKPSVPLAEDSFEAAIADVNYEDASSSDPVPSSMAEPAMANDEDDIPLLDNPEEFQVITPEFLQELEGEELFQALDSEIPLIEESKGLSLLKEMLEELSRPLTMSETVLLILRFSSEIMGRAVVFAIKEGQIVGMGQYGIELNGDNPDVRVRKMKIDLSEPSVLREAISTKRNVVKALDKNKWNDYLVEQLGGHVPPESYVSPLVVRGRVAIILYGDNAMTGDMIGDTSSLEIFLA
ncbi:MAG: DUF4388 domain-containing protein, partial [Deltaproteobacteria bacterium]|nr:DUF4388 domain-containing protein [Deltaproteobacteria bacterium]